MRLAKLLAAVMPVFCLSGCVESSRFGHAQGPLDEGLYYYEQDRAGRLCAISEPNTVNREKRQSTLVPQPALVDIDSTIHILVSPAKMIGQQGDSLFRERSAELLIRKQRILQALEGIQPIIEARKEAVALYASDDLDAFLQSKKRYASLQGRYMDELASLWPEGTPEYEAFSDSYDAPVFKKLQAFLQARIDEIEEADRKIADRAKNRRSDTLRIEAFLASPGKDHVPIHVDGYDLIEQQQLQRHDRLGLRLSPEEQQQLKTHMEVTRDVAYAANRVRAGEESLDKALYATLPLMAPRLKEILPRIKSLQDRIQKESMADRLDHTSKLFEEFVVHAKAEVPALANQWRAVPDEMAKNIIAALRDDPAKYDHLLKLFTEVPLVAAAWQAPTRNEVPDLVIRTSSLYNEISQLSLRQIIADVNDVFGKVVQSTAAALAEDAKASLEALLNGAQATALRQDLLSYYQDAKDAVQIVQELRGILLISQERPIPADIRAPDSLQVPLDDAKDTFVDLNYTPRRVGDVLTLRSTLYEKDPNDKLVEKDTSAASFQIDRFGYYADLSCAVVLVKPDSLEGTNDGFRFAPTLSWMHHYVPRAEDTDWYAPFLRTFRPSVGIHSAFLNFETEESDDAIQIGLGGTLAFWENRLQFGAGYNLMADSRDEGRYYFFIGTDLIGLLQSVGLGGANGAVRASPSD